MTSIDGAQVWVMGRGDKVGNGWMIMGIFETKDQATSHCEYPEQDFIAPMFIGTLLPDEEEPWPNLEFPLRDEWKRTPTQSDTE